MDFTNYINMEEKDIERFNRLDQEYKLMFVDPSNCSPKIIINVPTDYVIPWHKCASDPALMLKAELDCLEPHIRLKDDRVPAVHLQFGTALIAAAFGCEVAMFENDLPATKTHVAKDLEVVDKLIKPTLDDGWYPRVRECAEFYRNNLPDWIHVMLPDMQSPFNSTHLIRGNDVLYDFYDKPSAVEHILDLVADFMIDIIPPLKKLVDEKQDGWFYDWGSLWKGNLRLSNCSTHLISPQLYKDHVYDRDVRVLESFGSGRMHYCGSYPQIINMFFENPNVTGLDYDAKYHDLWELSEKAPENFVLSHWIMKDSPRDSLEKLLKGDWPKKKNIIIQVDVDSYSQGEGILTQLRKWIS